MPYNTFFNLHLKFIESNNFTIHSSKFFLCIIGYPNENKINKNNFSLTF
jgi:hypothetical protein